MNRPRISWLVAGAGIALAVCAMLAYTHLASAFAIRTQAAAARPCLAARSDQPSGEIARAQTVGTVTIAFAATPDPFGTYTFVVSAQSANCAPLQGATVGVVLTMPDMQMAALRIQLSPIGPAAPGSYQGQAVLSAGRWQALVRVVPQGATHLVQDAFGFSAR